MSPFELVNGQQPTTPHDLALVVPSVGTCPAAQRFAKAKHEMIAEARDSLEMAQRRMKKYADKHRRDVQFEVGDLVLLKLTPQIWKKISRKAVHRGLIPQYDGPFEVIKRVGNVAYRLKLPDRFKIHPTFHVSYLKKYNKDEFERERQKSRRAPPVIRKQFDKLVEKILDHRTMGQSKKNRRTDFLVQWKGEAEVDATWERDVTLWQFENHIADYWEQQRSTRTSTA